MSKLLLEVARCSNLESARCSSEHPCHKIVIAQGVEGERVHLPEPWNGSLTTAPLLFVSSNPSIGPDEDYPTAAWSDALIEDYFTNRFGGGVKEWTKDANRGLKIDGSYGRWSPFWSEIRERAREVFEREVVPGRDFALSEVVHCKSLRQQGVHDAVETCTDRYLLRVLESSAARVIIVLGRVAERQLRLRFPFSGSVSPPLLIGETERRVAVLPHPNAHTMRSFAKCLNHDDLEALRRLLS